MTITLVQGSDSTSGTSSHSPRSNSLCDPTDSTHLATFTLEGVPTGQESDVERALDSYYIRGSVLFFLPLLLFPFSLLPLSPPPPPPLSSALADIPYFRLKQMGLVISSSSRSFRTRPTPTYKRGKRSLPVRYWLPPTSALVGYGVLLALSAVFVGIVVSSFRNVGERSIGD